MAPKTATTISKKQIEFLEISKILCIKDNKQATHRMGENIWFL
jgi:hypothetical protein